MHAGRNMPFKQLLTPFLNTVSLVFKSLSWFNLFLKSRRRQFFPETFIISIDNLSFGGTGKTPLVIAIGQFLESKDIDFAIVTRGYRSRLEKLDHGTAVQSHHTIEDSGDEAQLFKHYFPAQDVFAGKNRVDSIRQAIRNKNSFILLDDGFQSSHINKNLSIMLINPSHPYYYLRHFKSLVRYEDIVLFLKNPDAGGGNNIKDGKRPDMITGMYDFEFKGACDFSGNPVDIGNQSIFGFSALGDNRRFWEDLKVFNLLGYTGFKDHHQFTSVDLEELDRQRRKAGAAFLVCTEKDFIKLKALNFHSIPFIYLKNSIKFNIDLMDLIWSHAKKEENV